MVPNVETVDPEDWHLATKLLYTVTGDPNQDMTSFGTTQLLTKEVSCKL
jgi:hypothetical protein